MARAAVVLQARMGSVRLPGKVLASIAGRSILARCVERLRARSSLPVIVATTTAPEDDRLALEASRLGVSVFRGPVDDVLMRYVAVATEWRLTALVRATADNPAVDPDAPARTLALLERTGASHVVEYGLPVGAAVEAVDVTALRRAAELTTEPYDREHVTPLLRRDRRFHALSALAPATVRCPALRLTVDTPADLAFVRRVFAYAGETPGEIIELPDLIAAARRALSLARVAGGSPTPGAVDAR